MNNCWGRPVIGAAFFYLYFMKKVFFILLCFCFAKISFAQKQQLTLDEHDQYTYYQVVDMSGFNADTLYSRCLAGLTQYYHNSADKKEMSAPATITIHSKLMVYNNTSMAKHEDGEITYTLHLEFKDTKYRYWLNEFILYPYQRNRYSTYEKIPGIMVPLEKVKAKYDNRTLTNYQEQIADFGKQLGENLKLYIINVQKTDAPANKIDTKKW